MPEKSHWAEETSRLTRTPVTRVGHDLVTTPPPPPSTMWGFPGGISGKKAASAGDIRSLGGEDPLEEGMATHSSILAWRIPWTEEPGLLQPIGFCIELDTAEVT